MDFLIAFSDTEGYFIARTRCDEPKLENDTQIVGHLSSLKQPYTSSEIIDWEGYTADLPNCAIFQP
jgi:hypothetical protein